MNKIIALMIIASSLFFGCSPTPASQDSVVSNDLTLPAGSSDYAPQPSDNTLEPGEAFISSAEVLSLESYPVQFSLVLKGNLPTPCHQLRVSIASPNNEQKILIEVYSVFDPNELCAEVIQEFEVNIPLGSYPGKQYTIWVNGEQVAEIKG